MAERVGIGGGTRHRPPTQLLLAAEGNITLLT